ncbi:hypothetical protein LBMAG18_07960 [Alphaproteobacteria bacterium]|nr:hypothetical protein LBMAG18_07960 [Alphaproteobacteria bacterium]
MKASTEISVEQSKKIYQLVGYLCPEETYKKMMGLNNSGCEVPKKFEFALKALGIPFSEPESNDLKGFKVVIDQAFIDFIDKIPKLTDLLKNDGSPSLSVADCALVYQAFNKKFSDD